MIKLKDVTVHKYKSFESNQTFSVEENITVLVGMNESGKTSVLEAIAKTNYFEDDEDFKFNLTHDYPRREKKAIDKSGNDPDAVTITYSISDELIQQIQADLGEGGFTDKEFKRTTKYSNKKTVSLSTTDFNKFIKNKTVGVDMPANLDLKQLIAPDSAEKLKSVLQQQTDDTIKTSLTTLSKYFVNTNKWPHDPIGEYVYRVHIVPHLPKFLYYDEYYTLPSRISINKLKANTLGQEELKTAKSLLELAEIDVDEILNADSFEDFKAELEATEAIISDELFKYWKTNPNLHIEFDIDKKIEGSGYNTSVEHILDIRVKNLRARVSLPLKNRSKGFNWFFSFLVWFKKIQEDKASTYVILLDEPGLNLHASAQSNLLNFLDDLSRDYQIIYTTHSPFMIEPDKLTKVRTVLETENGSRISDTIQEKDPNTLFPLQAALGYNIAQNLFISKHNLLVEGASDLLYLQVMSSILEAAGRNGLDNKVTIVPVGGLDKVSAFISLLRSNKLNIVCLLDTFKDAKGKAKLEDLMEQKIISEKKIRFFHEFVSGNASADIEDLFTKGDYLKVYNQAFPKTQVAIGDLNPKINPILIQLNQFLNIDRFNHYRPASTLASMAADASFFESQSLDNFENMFIEINKLF